MILPLILQPYVLTGYLTAAVTFTVGLFVLLKNPRAAVHRAFMLFALTITQWAFFSALMGMQTEYRWGLFFGKICHIGVLQIPVFFYYFTAKITGTHYPRIMKAGFLAALVLTGFTLTTPYFIPASRTDMNVRFMVSGGPLYGLIIAFFAFF